MRDPSPRSIIKAWWLPCHRTQVEWTMHKTIGVAELRKRFGAVFDEVVRGRVPYILERGDRPEAALIPYSGGRKG